MLAVVEKGGKLVGAAGLPFVTLPGSLYIIGQAHVFQSTERKWSKNKKTKIVIICSSSIHLLRCVCICWLLNFCYLFWRKSKKKEAKKKIDINRKDEPG